VTLVSVGTSLERNLDSLYCFLTVSSLPHCLLTVSSQPPHFLTTFCAHVFLTSSVRLHAFIASSLLPHFLLTVSFTASSLPHRLLSSCFPQLLTASSQSSRGLLTLFIFLRLTSPRLTLFLVRILASWHPLPTP